MLSIIICSGTSELITGLNLVLWGQISLVPLYWIMDNLFIKVIKPRRLQRGFMSYGFSPLSDDGKLSLEEFQSYFTDGILTDEQMQELYYSIDRQRTE